MVSEQRIYFPSVSASGFLNNIGREIVKGLPICNDGRKEGVERLFDYICDKYIVDSGEPRIPNNK